MDSRLRCSNKVAQKRLAQAQRHSRNLNGPWTCEYCFEIHIVVCWEWMVEWPLLQTCGKKREGGKKKGGGNMGNTEMVRRQSVLDTRALGHALLRALVLSDVCVSVCVCLFVCWFVCWNKT